MAASIAVMDEVKRSSMPLAMEVLDEVMTLAGHVLTTQPVVVAKTLSFLPALTLNTCARVCQLWRTIAEGEKHKRCQHYWHFFSFGDNVEASTDDIRSIQDCIVNLPIQPKHCVAFFTTHLVECHVSLPAQNASVRPKRRRIRKDSQVQVDRYLRHFLPRDCQMTAMATDGVVGTSANLRKTEEVEGGQALALLVLGQGAGLRLQSTILQADFVNRIVDLYGEEGSSLRTLAPPIPFSEDLRAVMYVSDQSFCPHELGFGLHEIYRKRYVFGGFVDQVIFEQEVEEEPTVSLLTFSGEHLRMASVIIKSSMVSKEEAEQVILKLKQCQLPEEKSVAFMFACIGRGRGHYGEDNVESGLFRKHFPRTPLLGFFGNGEIGYEYSCPGTVALGSHDRKAVSKEEVESGKEEEVCVFHKAPKMFHAYTTILTLLSWT